MTSVKTGTLIIIAAPSGAGKTTLVRALCYSLPNLLVSISYTTRSKRPGEENGVDYFFVDETTFKKMIDKNEFLEFAKVFDHYYGTRHKWVTRELATGSDVLLEIDWQGARKVKELIPKSKSIFILPPTYQSLETRLRDRGTDGDITINRRMDCAREELSHYREFDYLVINDELDSSLDELKAIIEAIRKGVPVKQTDHRETVERLLAESSKLQ